MYLILLPSLASAKTAAKKSSDLNNTKQIALSTIIYSNDYDNFAPLPSKWVDGIKPYVKSDSVFRSPAVVLKDENEYGYAFNISVSGESITSFESPSMLLSFFDSTDLLKNATTSTSTLPIPPRYGTKNTLAYVDGHVAPVTKRH